MSRSLVTCCLAGALLAACTVEQERVADWNAVPTGELSEGQRELLVRAIGARDALSGALGERLMAALEEGTPAEAITVCRDVAPQVASEISSARGVTIGRTSQRLRNPANKAPAWAAALVASEAEKQTTFAGPDGQLGVLLPIRAMALCLTCHGPADELDAEVAEVLAVEYPADSAVGYTYGDLRGWFWIEVGP